jgi:sugar phosphate permease
MSQPGVQSETAVAVLQPTRVRWRILVLLALTTAVATLGRLNLGITGKYVQDEFAFSIQTMGWIFSAFAFAYHPFQIPGGWAGDRFGPRKVLTFSILLWCAATVAMALVPGLPIGRWLGLAWSFAVFRFLIGIGEAPATPNSAKVVSAWMGAVRRGAGSSSHIVGIGLGGALTPVLITWMAGHWGWRTCFYFSSAAGTAIALGWWFYTTDRPEQHPGVNAAELALIRSSQGDHVHGRPGGAEPGKRAPWGRMLSSGTVWALLLSYFCQGYTPYIYITWFFIYLERVRGLTMIKSGLWGSTPFIAIVLLAPLGGWLSDRAVVRFGRRRGRQSTVWLGMGCSAFLLFAGSHTLNNTAAILMLATAAGFNYFAATSWWATCIDLAPNFSASLGGLMNACGGSWLAPIATAYIATHFGWTRALDFAGLLTAIAAFLWIFVNAGQNLEPSLTR